MAGYAGKYCAEVITLSAGRESGDTVRQMVILLHLENLSFWHTFWESNLVTYLKSLENVCVSLLSGNWICLLETVRGRQWSMNENVHPNSIYSVKILKLAYIYDHRMGK